MSNSSGYRVFKNKLLSLIPILLLEMKIPSSDFDVSFVSAAEIKKLNRKFRKKNKVTDVLSFPLYESKQAKQNGLFLGDLVICPEKAFLQAGQFKHTQFEELLFLLIHGFLHLLGYDHELGAKEEAKMQKLEKKLWLKCF